MACPIPVQDADHVYRIMRTEWYTGECAEKEREWLVDSTVEKGGMRDA